jgi:hypothetical protein
MKEAQANNDVIVADIRNQEVTIRRLEEQLAEYSTKVCTKGAEREIDNRLFF